MQLLCTVCTTKFKCISSMLSIMVVVQYREWNSDIHVQYHTTYYILHTTLQNIQRKYVWVRENFQTIESCHDTEEVVIVVCHGGLFLHNFNLILYKEPTRLLGRYGTARHLPAGDEGQLFIY